MACLPLGFFDTTSGFLLRLFGCPFWFVHFMIRQARAGVRTAHDRIVRKLRINSRPAIGCTRLSTRGPARAHLCHYPYGRNGTCQRADLAVVPLTIFGSSLTQSPWAFANRKKCNIQYVLNMHRPARRAKCSCRGGTCHRRSRRQESQK